MLTLDATTQTLELQTGAAVSTDYVASWLDSTTTTFTPGAAQGNVATATTTTIVAAPAASTQRGIKHLSVYNRSTTATQTVAIKKDVSATEYTIISATLAPGHSLQYSEDGGWAIFDSLGNLRRLPAERTGYTGRSNTIHKSGGAADAVGYWYCTSKDGGFPGAFAPGTPGLAGRTTDGTTTTDAGCIPFQNPASGAMYLTGAAMWSSTVHPHWLVDLLWINSGIAVTTVTAQTINSVAFPSRDTAGAANGEGCMIGLLVAVATTNGAVINNTTISYTNSQGTAGRTATLEAVVGMQIPATAVAGTLVWFKLQAGDTGVQSIQSITLNTSLGAGTVHLIVARPIVQVSTVVVGMPANAVGIENPGIRLYNGTCLIHCYRASATTATVVGGIVTMMER
ncbi:MAG: hypothetical protein IT300_18250 [Dehalococcoidia bacterium]|nr:hypothetical protein [Dehalococcoidia bacterium]